MQKTITAPPAPPVKAKAAPERLSYALTGYTAERRKTGWFVAPSYSPFYEDRPRFVGPFESIDTAMLSVARHQAAELADRHTRDIERHKILKGAALYGLQGPLSLSAKARKSKAKT